MGISDSGEQWNETIEVDTDKQTELFKVPGGNNKDHSIILRDFKTVSKVNENDIIRDMFVFLNFKFRHPSHDPCGQRVSIHEVPIIVFRPGDTGNRFVQLLVQHCFIAG